MTDMIQTVQTLALTYGLNLIGALLIFFIGRWAAGFGARMVKKLLDRGSVNQTLVNFAASLTQTIILVFAIVAAFEQMGVETTSLVALLGAAGLAVGLALQGSLANFAAGVMILFFQPFKIGDLIEGGGAFGVVEEIQIFNTIIITPDNKTVIVSNAQITGNNITNYSAKGMLRLDLVFGIGYDDDLLKAKRLLNDMLSNDERVLSDPSPTVAVLELADSTVNFAVRPYVKVEDYWDVHFDLTERVKLLFDKEGISIPYPQHDVHLFQPATS